MIPVESSQISKSATSKTDTSKANLLNGTKGKLDIIFPLIDQAITYVKIPRSVFVPFKIYFYLQQLLACMWPMSKALSRMGLAQDQIFGLIQAIFLFFDCYNYDSTRIIALIIIAAVTVISIALLAWQIYYYHHNKSFMKWGLYLTRFIVDIIYPCIITPCAVLIGLMFVEINNDGDALSWLFFFVGIISLFIYLFIFRTCISFAAHSVIIPVSVFPTFNANTVIHLVFNNSICTILSFVMSIFPEWMELFVPIIHILWCTYNFKNGLLLPFTQMLDIVIMFALHLTIAISDIYIIVFYFTDYGFMWLPFIITYVVFAIGCVVSYLIAHSMRNKIKRELNVENDYPEEDDLFEYFKSLELDVKPSKALKYLYNGVSQCCETVADISLLKFLTKNSSNNDVLMTVLQMLTYFPSEMRALNALFRGLSNRRDISFEGRFMIYQIYRVKSLRASSSSVSTNDKIAELKQLNGEVEANIKSFWSMLNPKYTYAEEISEQIAFSEIQWKDAVDTYPNNEKIATEFARFLCESKADFDAAIYQRQRVEMIENGHNFAIDNSFRSFVRTFPNYLLNEVIDLKGKRIRKNNKDKGPSSSSSARSNSNSQGSNTFSSTFTIDAELEEAIGKRIMKSSRMRLALHHSIEDKKSPLVKWMHFSAVLLFICCLAVYIFLFVFMDEQFTTRSQSVVCMNEINLARLNTYLVLDTLELYYAVTNSRFGNLEDTLGAGYQDVDAQFNNYIDVNGDLQLQTMQFIQDNKDALTGIFTELAAIADQGTNIYNIAGAMLSETTSIHFCRNTNPAVVMNGTIKNKIIFGLYQASVIAGSDLSTFWSQNEMCELIDNFYDLPTDFGAVFEAFDQKQIGEGDDLKSILDILVNILPPVVAVFCFIPIFVMHLVSAHQLNQALSMLANLDPQIKEEAKAPLSLDAEATDQTSTIKEGARCSRTFISLFIIAVGTIIECVLVFLFIHEMQVRNDEIIELGTWFNQATKRTSATVEVFCDFIGLILLNMSDAEQPTYVSNTEQATWIPSDLANLETSNNCLLKSCEGVTSCYGYDDEIDSIHFQEQCDFDAVTGTMHDVYGCASQNQQLSILIDLGNQIEADPTMFNGGFYGDAPIHMYHLVSNHLLDTHKRVAEMFMNKITNMHDTVYTKSIIFLVFGILLAVIGVLAIEAYIKVSNETYKVILILIKHLPPLHLVACKGVMDFLMNRKTKEDDKAMGTAQSIIHNTSDAILCTGLNGIVEIANPAVTNLLGYTPDQILGQHINNFLTDAAQEVVSKQMALMVNGQAALSYDDHITCLSDSASIVNFYATIIGMKNEGSSNIQSFVFILSDETELLKQQKEAEKAKADSEKLLYQILPKDIVIRLNRGEKDITFTVAHATIIFIDIVKFSDYSSSLTPQEIMGNLSVVFAAFDENIAKYLIMTKIKLIGDVYMAAAGLFSPEDQNPQIHAESTIKFAIDCLTDLEEINMKLNASLEVRIGVNTGGPVLAGVLGTDKPTFDIIGDPINVASRLQSTDIPGKVQISKATYELVQNSNFNIEERGEVFLKGKGKQMTYIVHPHIAFMAQSSSIMSITDSGQKANV